MSLFNNGLAIGPELYTRGNPYGESLTDSAAIQADDRALDINLSAPAKVTLTITSTPMTQVHLDNGTEPDVFFSCANCENGGKGNRSTEWTTGDGTSVGDVKKETQIYNLSASVVDENLASASNRASATIKVEYLKHHKYRRDNGVLDLEAEDVDDNFEIIKNDIINNNNFLSLSDTPNTLTADKWLKVNSAGDALEETDAPSGGSGSFIELSDTPTTLTADKWLKVNSAGDALEETDAPNTGLEAIDEGNGVGWRLIGRNPANYGNIGLDAVQLMRDYYGQASSTRGATGAASACIGGSGNTASGAISACIGGSGNTASGDKAISIGGMANITSGLYQATCIGGQDNLASGNHSMCASGIENIASSGWSSCIGGMSLRATSKHSTVIGKYNAYNTTVDNEDVLFIVGNGADDANRSNALEVRTDGGIKASQLPTTAPTETGMLWNNAGVINIS